MTPDQVRALTLYQLRLITEGYEKTDQRSRYRRMGDAARATAKRIHDKTGQF